jgi:hypothetical protein
MTDEKKPKSLFKLSEVLSIAGTALLILLTYTFIKGAHGFRELAARDNIQIRPFSDWLYIGICALCFIPLRNSFYILTQKRLEASYDKSRPDYDLVRQKAARQAFDILYYSAMTCYAVYYVWGQPWQPWVFGGSGSCQVIGHNWPNVVQTQEMRIFYIVQMGHHLHNLIKQLITKHNNGNWYEMLLHHYATFIAMLFSYWVNFEDCGIAVLLAHDFSDVILNLAKLIRDMRLSEIMVDILFVVLMASFLIHRVLAMSLCVFGQLKHYMFFMPYYHKE